MPADPSAADLSATVGEGRMTRWNERDEMDDAIHILYPGNVTMTLCKQTDRMKTQAITDPWPGGMEGCWTCLIEAEKIANRSEAADAR